jgi:hypothetical protein
MINLLSWREMCARAAVMRGIPSIYFQQNNYLIKMLTDSVSAFRSKQTMKMWLGFEPNAFMVPPVPHEPQQIRLQLEGRRRAWIRSRQEWINNQLSHLQNLSGNHTGTSVNRRHTMTSSQRGDLPPRSEMKVMTGVPEGHAFAHPSPSTLRATQSSPIVIQKGVATTSSPSTPKTPPSGPPMMMSLSRQLLSPMPSSDPPAARSAAPFPSVTQSRMTTSNSATQLSTAQSSPHALLIGSASTPSLSSTPAAVVSTPTTRPPTVFFPESHAEGNEDEESEDENSSHGSKKQRGHQSGEDEDGGMKAARTSISASHHVPSQDHAQDSSPRETDTDDMSSTSFGSSSVTSQLDEEWRELSHQCLPSWGSPTDPLGKLFWDNFDQNPTLVEAAIGFIDAFPSIFLVPPLSLDLAHRCHHCEHYLEKEIILQIERKDLQTFVTKKQESFNLEEIERRHDLLFDLPLNISSDGMAAADPLDLSLYSQQLMIQNNLKLRQEQSGVRDIFHPGDIPPSLCGGGMNSSSNTQIPPLSARPVILSHEPGPGDHVNSFNIFLTSSPHSHDHPPHPHHHPPHPHPPHPHGDPPDPHLNSPLFYKINSTSLQQIIENRVRKQTTRLMRIGDALVLIKDRSSALQKYISITPSTNKISSIQATIIVQALIRGALIRWRLRRKKRALAKMTSLLLLQKYGRRYIAKIRLARKRREFRLSCLVLRKAINRRYRAAVIIQNFMKYALFLVHRQDYLRKYNNHTNTNRQSHHPSSSSTYYRYLQSATIIQKIFRGYKQRNDFMKWSATMRLLATTSHSRQTIRNKLKYNFTSSTHRTLHYTVAGSGGFQFKFRKKEINPLHVSSLSSSSSSNDLLGDQLQQQQQQQQEQQLDDQEKESQEKNKTKKSSGISSTSSSKLDPKLMTLILTQSDHFQTLLVGENAGIEMVRADGGEGSSGRNGDSENVRGEMRLLPLLSEEQKSPTDDDFSFQSTPLTSPVHESADLITPVFESILPGSTAAAATGTGTGNRKTQIPQRSLSRQNTFGTSIISTKVLKRLASNGERSFIQHPYGNGQVDHGFDPEGARGEEMEQGGERQRGTGGWEEMKRRSSVVNGLKMKSTNEAYVNPSVHNKSIFKRRKDSLKQTDQHNSDGLKFLLKSVYGQSDV